MKREDEERLDDVGAWAAQRFSGGLLFWGVFQVRVAGFPSRALPALGFRAFWLSGLGQGLSPRGCVGLRLNIHCFGIHEKEHTIICYFIIL